MSEPVVVLVNMPWASLTRPSIQLGILQSVLSEAGIRVQVRSLNLAFMDFVAAHPSENDQPFVFEDYFEISGNCYSFGLGDWIFAVPPFRDANDSDETYFEYVRRSTDDHKIVEKAVHLRRLVPAFLEQCAEEILEGAPSVVGFTTTFSQNVPSLVLAKQLKEKDPTLHVVFGGANCDGPMGDAMHRSFPWVDSVVRGEGERVLPRLVMDLHSGWGISPQAGLCYWDGKQRVAVPQENGAEICMDDVPTPNYDEYFERLEESSYNSEILKHLSLPFESARGCWWGAKLHCTFCGLNGSSMPFRSKSPDRVVEDLTTLARKHRQLNFKAVDNIIAMPYFEELLPKLRDSGYDFKLFYETKSNLKKEQLRAMRDAGVLEIQPGIESFSTPILRLMKKGVSALQNIRLLKWCEEFGIDVIWSVLYGFPGEPVEEMDRMTDLIDSLTHLQPPLNVGLLDLQRFSPYHQRPRDYGLEIVGPREFYALVYACDESALNDIAYTFRYCYDDDRKPYEYIAALRSRIETWRSDYLISSLTYERGPGFLLINDQRAGLGGSEHTLGETEAKVYLSCDAGATSLAVWNALRADGETEISREDVEDFLDELTEMKLMYEEDGVYLSLAVASNVRTTVTDAESKDVHAMTASRVIPSYQEVGV